MVWEFLPAGLGVCHHLVKNHIDGRDRRPSFVLSVICSALIVGGWVVLAWSRISYWGTAEMMYMCDSPIETVECIWVNIWCMLDWIWSRNCRNTLLLHWAGQLARSAKNGNCLYIQPGIRHRPDGSISDCESWDISGSWLYNVLSKKKGTTIVWCGLSVKGSCFVI